MSGCEKMAGAGAGAGGGGVGNGAVSGLNWPLKFRSKVMLAYSNFVSLFYPMSEINYQSEFSFQFSIGDRPILFPNSD